MAPPSTTTAIGPRPSIAHPCSCIWAALDQQREQEAASRHELQTNHSTLSSVKDAVQSLPFIGSKSDNPAEEASTSPEDLPRTTPQRPARAASASQDRRPIAVDLKFGTINATAGDHNAVVARMDAKAALLKKSGWLGKARPFRLFGTSQEVKVGELISYREDLVYILDSLIPSRRIHDQHSTHPPAVLPVPHTPLCATCQQRLAYSLINAPAAHNTFVRESATSAFLALLDDATASLKGSLPLEYITHHQVDSIFRHELAVVEWRIAANLAKFHKSTGFLKEFPVRLGEYGQFQVNVKPPGAPEGIVAKAGKKLKSAVGLGSEPPSGEVQGPASQTDS
ncbi:hypothetical protein BDZ88DRAFT_426761 [Geranomyces variabilis]|nr:hypothetical protein BDZ88DRAFT_426761 [Geranomyces variabilis]KAJ3131964.1 hypothetical protein HDU90_007626 [Geranomyces variabilis]